MEVRARGGSAAGLDAPAVEAWQGGSGAAGNETANAAGTGGNELGSGRD